jgi:2-keto-4-pentenoate hydratase/2-oxohepta-3-ene-1,7-dioic acid hydratase in catechol pathway
VVNGEPRPDLRTADMVHDTPRRVEDLASVMTLEPGDVIATGAPAGTAFGRTPLAYARPGTSCGAETDGLGEAWRRRSRRGWRR